MSSILILSPDVITERMAGPAIRYWEFAQALAPYHRVTLTAPNDIPLSLQSATLAQLRQHSPENITELLHEHDIVLFQGYIFDYYPQLQQTEKILIADLYDPVPLEGLERHKTPASEDMQHIAAQVQMMNRQLQLADYFLCASERQRDLWLGHLLALGRINPLTYSQMQQRIITVPFGLPNIAPKKTEAGFRQILGISPSDLVLLWGGGIWEWFDPLTVIRAVHQLVPNYPNLKLVFLGTRHPNPTIPPMPMQQRAETLARELNLYGTHVLFQEGWVPYHSLANHLLEANVGISAHFDTLESHFAFRTRILHYLWAGKPIITTQGDILADEVARFKAGIIVKVADVEAWMAAIKMMYTQESYATYLKGVEQLAQHYFWTTVTQPLNTLCTQATLAPDRMLEPGRRKSLPWDCELECNSLKSKVALLEQELAIIERSNSWKITAPLRNLRRRLTRWK
jgi:glycosyltransferase involved in cell wall biosynthesis